MRGGKPKVLTLGHGLAGRSVFAIHFVQLNRRIRCHPEDNEEPEEGPRQQLPGATSTHSREEENAEESAKNGEQDEEEELCGVVRLGLQRVAEGLYGLEELAVVVASIDLVDGVAAADCYDLLAAGLFLLGAVRLMCPRD